MSTTHRISTRDQILEALSESPKGLTLPQLADFCTACEHDEQIVGNMIAILHREDVIHAGNGLRDAMTVWIEGKQPQELHEAPLSLAGAEQRSSTTASEAARAIANMRQGPKVAAKPADITASKPVPVRPAQEGAALTLRAKIERALRDHGPMRATDIEKHVQEKYVSRECSALLTRKFLVKLGGNKRGTIYGLPGQSLADRKDNSTVKGRQPAALARPANGGGAAAVPPAAVPAVSSDPKPAAPNDEHHHVFNADLELGGAVARGREAPKGNGENLYQAALLDLQERRDLLMVQVTKLEVAIEAMRALT